MSFFPKIYGEPMTPEQIEICKRIFKPLRWGKSDSAGINHDYYIIRYGVEFHLKINSTAIGIYKSIETAKAAAELHYYETLAENLNWEEIRKS